MTSLETYKTQTLRKNMSLPSLQKSWRVWQPQISAHLGSHITGEKIFDLGEVLSDIFQSNKVTGRGQSAVSTGGTAWECFNVWYLNFLFWGTPVVVTRTNHSLVPECLRNAITVTHSSVSTNTESDISIFNVPDENLLSNHAVHALNLHLSSRMQQVNFLNLQCKTNWNDNAQVPMLWDLIYNVDSFKISNVSVGIKGVSPNSFASFGYAFSTVPTVKKDKFKQNSVAVLRVKNLAGGNYWGHATKEGIAKCINELAGNHFSKQFSGGIISHLDRQITNDPNFVSRFLNLSF